MVQFPLHLFFVVPLVEAFRGYCPDIPNIPNGFIDAPRYTFMGQTLRIRCFKDYIIAPGDNSYITCTHFGTWSQPGLCIPENIPGCSDKPQVANAWIQPGNSFIGTKRFFICDSRHVLAGSNFTLCGFDMQWKAAGECILAPWVKRCPDKPKIENSRVSAGDGSVEPGSRREFNCLEGFYLTGGPNYAICREDGNWFHAGSCQPDCLEPPKYIQNGMIQLLNSESLKIVCNRGYLLQGPASSSCDHFTGRWSQIGNCVPFVQPRPVKTPQRGFQGSLVCCGGYTVFSAKLIESAREGDFEEVSELLTTGADPNSRNVYGWTALGWAAAKGHARILDRLLDCCARVDLPVNPENETALMLASQTGILVSVDVLLRKGADLLKRDLKQRNCLHYAAIGGNVRVAELLLQQRNSFSLLLMADFEGNTPLHTSVRANNSLAMIQSFIASGAFVNAQNMNGQTPLTLAVRSQNFEAIEILIRAGADTSLQEVDGSTAMDIAQGFLKPFSHNF